MFLALARRPFEGERDRNHFTSALRRYRTSLGPTFTNGGPYFFMRPISTHCSETWIRRATDFVSQEAAEATYLANITPDQRRMIEA